MYVGVQGRITRPQPLDYGIACGLIAALCGRYAYLRRTVIGRSGLGREIPAVVLSADAPRERVLMVSALGAQEWLTALLALRLCEETCSHLRANLKLCDVSLARGLKGRQIWFVPLPNPDGAEIARYGSIAAGAYAAAAARMGADIPGRWRGNAYGVNICSNFTAGREEMQAFPRKNGEKSAIQPETAALCDLCRRVSFRHAVVLGCGGGIGWQAGEDPPPRSRMMAQVLSAVSGLPMGRAIGCGEFAAWFMRTYRRAALTIGIGDGAPPLPLREFEETYAATREMLLLSLLF
ncbi:MAG: hypothetical protein IJN04_01525 [Clostridia bacterium]|nr:hypothetical protein [Clostridia bacterium]